MLLCINRQTLNTCHLFIEYVVCLKCLNFIGYSMFLFLLLQQNETTVALKFWFCNVAQCVYLIVFVIQFNYL